MLKKLVLTLACLGSLVAFAEGDFATYLADKHACFLQRDLRTGKTLRQEGGDFCHERLSPESTFKVPLALMAFEKGILKDSGSSMKWDGQKYEIESWNSDQTARTWLLNSVVWFSQKLTPQLGMPYIAQHLKDFKYGNEDFTTGIDKAWLDASLKINAEEQTEFLRRLKNRKLDLKKKTIKAVLEILPVEAKGPDFELAGKTGSGSSVIDSATDKTAMPLRIGWYVGYYKKGKQESVFATVFQARKEPSSKYGGPEAKQLTRKLLGIPD